MIEINVVPVQLRKKRKKAASGNGMYVPLEVIIGLGGGLIMLLVLAHFVLLAINISKVAQYKGYKKLWESILPSKGKVDAVVNELRALQTQFNAVNTIAGNQRLNWSRKLNIISDSLPRDVWIKRISLTDEMLFIEGSALSKQYKEMLNVHTFSSNLRSQERFMEELEELELDSIQTANMNKVELADFVIKSKLRKDEPTAPSPTTP